MPQSTLKEKLRAAYAALKARRERAFYHPTAADAADIDAARAAAAALHAEIASAFVIEARAIAARARPAAAEAAARAEAAAAHYENDTAGHRRNDDGTYAKPTLDYTAVLHARAEAALVEARAAAAASTGPKRRK